MAVLELVERVVRWASEPPREGRLAQARELFEQQTAPIETSQRDYESRIAHFFDWFICAYTEDGSEPPVAAYAAAHAGMPPEERRMLAGLLRSHRALLEVSQVHPHVELTDVMDGGRFALGQPAGRLAPGEVLDGRVLWDGEGTALCPGRVFHPADTHAPIRSLMTDARVRALPRELLLNNLLAMRDRLQRFTRVRAEHLYTADAIGSEAFSATWKRGEKEHDASEEAPRSKGP